MKQAIRKKREHKEVFSPRRFLRLLLILSPQTLGENPFSLCRTEDTFFCAEQSLGASRGGDRNPCRGRTHWADECFKKTEEEGEREPSEEEKQALFQEVATRTGTQIRGYQGGGHCYYHSEIQRSGDTAVGVQQGKKVGCSRHRVIGVGRNVKAEPTTEVGEERPYSLS